MFSYPQSDLDRGSKILSLLGSFWFKFYEGRGLLEEYVRTRAEAEKQTWLNLLEAVRTFSRYEVPIFHTQNWYLLTLRKSEKGKVTPKFGEEFAFGQGLNYDVPFLSKNNLWPIPDDLIDAPLILNKITGPSVVMTHGIDYVLDRKNKRIWFRSDPFENDLLAVRTISRGNGETDEELALWIFRGNFDYEHVYRHWGYVLDLKLSSSEEYKNLVNAVFDALVGGTTLQNVLFALSAMTGIPLVRERKEVVEEIARDSENLFVITDKHAYRFNKSAQPSVSVGDTVRACDSLIDGFKVYDLNSGKVPEDVIAISAGRGLLVGKFHSEILFENAVVPLKAETDEEGYTRVEFPLGGFPADVEEFWNIVHKEGKARGKTLAHTLDLRDVKQGEPPAEALPREINPLEFLVKNFLRYHACLIKLKVDDFINKDTGMFSSGVLRKIIPPGSAVIVIIDMPKQEDSVILNDRSEGNRTGGYGEISAFDGAETRHAQARSAPPNRIVRNPVVSIWSISGTCQ